MRVFNKFTDLYLFDHREVFCYNYIPIELFRGKCSPLENVLIFIN